MRTAASPIRFAWAVAFALLLGLRVLTPAGFMPAFDRGAVTIVACPDADAPLMPTMHHHHHGDHRLAHQPCPYASASALGAVGADWTPFMAVLVFAAMPLVGRRFPFAERQIRHERPPAIGPPVPA